MTTYITLIIAISAAATTITGTFGLIATTTAAPKKPTYSSSSGGTNKKRKTETKDGDAAPKKAKTAPAQKKKIPKMMMTANGMKPRVTSQGNKRMSIPDEAFPDFCRRIGPFGTGERMKLINKFAEDYPETSIRQVTLKLGEITCKEPPACVDMTGRKVRAFMFYLRPRYYKHLHPEDRPDNWEKFAALDDQLWEMEEEQKMNEKLMQDIKDQYLRYQASHEKSVEERKVKMRARLEKRKAARAAQQAAA